MWSTPCSLWGMPSRSKGPAVLLSALLLASACASACTSADDPDESSAATEQAQTSREVTPESMLVELFDRRSVARVRSGGLVDGPRFSTVLRSSRSPLGPDSAIRPVDERERASTFARCGVELANPCARDMNMDFVDGNRDGEVEIDRVDLPLGGVLTRFWTVIDPNVPAGAEPRTIRFYVDDNPVPLVLALPSVANATLPFPFGDPAQPLERSVLGGVTENGIDVYTPITFARTLRITSSGRPTSGRLYWQATLRRYEERVSVAPMPTTEPALGRLRERARALSAAWSSAPSFGVARLGALELPGAGVVDALTVTVPAEARESDIERARLVVTTDGAAAPDVDVSLLDFFATRLARDGRRAVVDTQTGFVSARNLASVPRRGVPFELTSRWPIPFARGARVEIRGLPRAAVRAAVGAADPSLALRLRIMTASASANAAEPYVARVLDVVSRGVYAGTTLVVDNGTDPTWWGEGDELVRVDGELALAGTGVEDYFGYGYSSSSTFASPLHAQTVASNVRPGIKPASWAGQDTYDNSGITVNVRAMVLDRIPFSSHLTFDLEMLHTHWLRPFMRDAPPARVRWNAPYAMRLVHILYTEAR